MIIACIRWAFALIIQSEPISDSFSFILRHCTFGSNINILVIISGARGREDQTSTPKNDLKRAASTCKMKRYVKI